MVNKADKSIICTHFSTGRCHDFTLFRHSKLTINKDITIKVDSGYQGIQKQHSNSVSPQKNSKKHPLTQEQKKENRKLAVERMTNEHVIGVLKRFRILSCRNRNRRKRFGLRFNLIAAIYNVELA